jgi:Pyruvate/2-oxoacid:ferredoxin oxidoreductase delta subunit
MCLFIAALLQPAGGGTTKGPHVLSSLERWVFPFHRAAIRKPAYAALRYAFHICLFAVPIWLDGHVVLWEESRFGWSWECLPDVWADWMALGVLGCAAFFILRRIAFPEVRKASDLYQILIIIMVSLPFLTGYFLAHGTLDPFIHDSHLEIIHVLSGVFMIMGAVFLFYKTRLNPEKCVGCGSCVVNCPTATLVSMDRDELRHFRYRHYQCICCATCVDVCPENAMGLGHTLSFKMFIQFKRRERVHVVPLSLCRQCGDHLMPVPQQSKLSGIINGECKILDLCPKCKIQHAAGGTKMILGLLPVLFYLTLLSGAALVSPLEGAKAEEIPEEIIINNDGYGHNRKGAVYFPHLDHADGYDISCDSCHHDYVDGENVWKSDDPVAPCASCHDHSESDGSLVKLRLAFHKNCKTCHQELDREVGTDAPYKTCLSCHEKK